MDQSWADSPLELTNQYLPQSYDLSLKLDHVKPNFQGQVRIPLVENSLYNGEANAPFCLSLHAHKLIVTSAQLQTTEGVSQKLKVSYDRPHQRVVFSAEGVLSATEITVSFLGSVASIKTFHDETYGVFKTNYSDSVQGRSDNYVIATHAQPFGCRSIFPVVDELTHKVPISLSITTKSSFKVVSNAPLSTATIVDMTENSVFTFKPTPPIAPSVFGFMIGDFEKIENISGITPVCAYVTKGDSQYAQYALKTAVSLLPVFETVLGVKYPLEKLDIVALPFLSDAVMENWGMITVIKDALFLDETSASEEAKIPCQAVDFPSIDSSVDRKPCFRR
ncbi:hypothetical protein JCM33374_g5899 [Metschnikowia sp. JCM 33374]|nr:hypothetical protein JCM33374_g5899 [Metschnikowia sp. JCM 33374]